MQVVIEISEQDFSHVVNTGKTCDNSIYIAFKNAIILPAHGRLIDADALEWELTASDRDIYIHEWLDEMPTIIAPSKGVTECRS